VFAGIPSAAARSFSQASSAGDTRTKNARRPDACLRLFPMRCIIGRPAGGVNLGRHCDAGQSRVLMTPHPWNPSQRPQGKRCDPITPALPAPHAEGGRERAAEWCRGQPTEGPASVRRPTAPASRSPARREVLPRDRKGAGRGRANDTTWVQMESHPDQADPRPRFGSELGRVTTDPTLPRW
jgi:hypothetical protein